MILSEVSRGVDVTPSSEVSRDFEVIIPLFVSDEASLTIIDNEVVIIGKDLELVLATPSSAFDESLQVMPEIIKFREHYSCITM